MSVCQRTNPIRPLVDVEVDVGLEPGCLLKLDDAMNFRQLHSELQVELQVAVVQHVLALVAQIRNQFLTAVRFWEAGSHCARRAGCRDTRDPPSLQIIYFS